MTILVFSAFFAPERVGSGYTRAITELVRCWSAANHRVLILTTTVKKELKQEIINGAEVVRLPAWNPPWLNGSFPLPRPMALIRALRIIRSQSIDLVLTFTRFFPTSWLGFIFAKISGKPIIHTEFGSQHIVVSNKVVFLIGWLIDHLWGGAISRWSNAAVGNSEAACQFLKHLGARKVIKIHIGTNIDFWYLKKRMVADHLNITYVGRLIYGKGVQDLIKALTRVSLPLTLNLIGDGPYRPTLEALVQNLNLRAKVKFWGELDHSAIKEVFSQTDVFVNPSYSEGLPTAVLEAAAAGLAIIATKVGGTVELMPPPCHDFLINPGDVPMLAQKIILLAENRPLREFLGRITREYVREKFQWEKISQQYLELFDQYVR